MIGPEVSVNLSVIRTDRLVLVPPKHDHAYDLHEYGRDPRFAEALKGRVQSSPDDAVRFIDSLISDNATGERAYWVALLEGKAVGTLGFILGGLRRYREGEFGYGFSPACWGRGVALEAGTACLAYGFDALGLARIRVYARASNTRALNYARRLGFEDDLELHDFYPEGEACQSLFRNAPHSNLTLARQQPIPNKLPSGDSNGR